MKTLVLIVAAVGVGFVLLSGRGARGRRLTAADLPKLRELQLRRARVGLEYRLCVQKANTHSLLTGTQVFGAAAGLFAAAAGGSADAALKIARSAESLATALVGSSASCEPLRQKAVADLAAHDALAESLGLDPNIPDEEIRSLVASLGGHKYAETPQTVSDCVRRGNSPQWCADNQLSYS